MFHCNGWCFPWSITLLAGTHLLLRQVEARALFNPIADRGVTHLCGAPVVISMLAGCRATAAFRDRGNQKVGDLHHA
jgi:fatty-acyl-CoA synthase